MLPEYVNVELNIWRGENKLPERLNVVWRGENMLLERKSSGLTLERRKYAS